MKSIKLFSVIHFFHLNINLTHLLHLFFWVNNYLFCILRDNVYTLFMKAHHCCDLIPLSVKITAISSDLPILKAFCAYIYNGVRASPLYFSELQGFNGMITATDFIEIMTKFYHDGPVSDVLKDLEGFTINNWLTMQKSEGQAQKPFIYVDPQDSLYKAVQVMFKNHIHRLALVDQVSGNVEFIVSYKRLLKFIFIYIKDLPFPTYMCGKPKELGIGEWNNVVTVSENLKIIDLFRIFVKSKKCFLPVVDEDMKLVNCCSKVDVVRYNIYHHLDTPIHKALNDPARNFYGVYTCTENDCLMTVLEKMAKYDVHRLIAVDADEKVIGLVSLSDIFRFLVLEPPQTAEPRGMYMIDRQELTTTVTIEDSD
uniref:5'-AMP-activated protein kinase subunit gamma-1-like n=1 Tax=Syphacia muris TaxID=451379 RepID=A0A0N5AYQ0_9BILA